MDYKKWAAWTEIVASIAVVVTLAFLIYEVRQNTAAIERQTFLDRQARLVNPYMESPEFRTIYSKIKNKDGREPRVEAFINHYGLSDEEAVYWVRHLDENWSGIEADFAQFGPSDEIDEMIIGFLRFPDAELYWESVSQTRKFSAAFREHVQSLASDESRLEQSSKDVK